MKARHKTLLALSIIPQILIVRLLSFFPETVEQLYSNGLYVFLSKIERYVLGWLPFSFGDVVYLLALVYAVRWLIKNRKRLRKDTKNWFVDVFSAISIMYFAFHLLWGLNYHRVPLHQHLNLEDDFTTEELVSFTEQLIKKANAVHLNITKNDTLKVEMPYSKSDIMQMAPQGYDHLKNTFPRLSYSPKSVKKSLFSLPLTYMGFSGYLNPFTNEAQVDYLIPAYKLPTTTSHEIAHQLGYAAENEANFIGCMAAINHEDVYFNYSGYVFALQHCLTQIYRRDECLFEELKPTVNIGIRKNYKESQDFWERHRNPLEPLFKQSYNSYLKANSQKDGMKSYGHIVSLLVNYFKGRSF